MESSFQAPKGEIVWVRGFDSNGAERYIITSNKLRDHYFLYVHEKDGWTRTAKARSPINFEGRVKLY